MLKVKLDCQFNDFDLTVNQQLPSDRIIGLFGASGSGKSRFIRQLLGFDLVHQKKVHIQFKDRLWQDSNNEFFLPIQNREIGYLPQSIDLFPHLSIEQNILFGWKKQTSKFDQAMIKNICLQLDIQSLLQKNPQQLSGGQQQRVALARAILVGSRILILDEPLSAIGEDHKPQVMQLLRYLQQVLNIPIIYSSHNRMEHAFLTDYLMTFKAGQIIQSGDYESIATDINGDFSQMSDAINHIKAEVIEFEQECFVNRLKTKQHQLWAGYQPLKKGHFVNLEIRAQDISLFLSQSDQSSILNSLKVTIVDFEEISSHQYVIKLSFENSFLVAFITKKSFISLGLKKNLKVYAKFKSLSVLPISLDLD